MALSKVYASPIAQHPSYLSLSLSKLQQLVTLCLVLFISAQLRRKDYTVIMDWTTTDQLI